MVAAYTKTKRGLLEVLLVGSRYATDYHSTRMSWKFWISDCCDYEEHCFWKVTSCSLEDINILVEHTASIFRVEQ